MRQVALGARSCGGSRSARLNCGTPHLLSAEAPRCPAKPRSPRWRGRSPDRANVTRRRCRSGRAAGPLPLTGPRRARGEGTGSTKERAAQAPARPPGARAGPAPSTARPPYCGATQTCYTRAPTPPPPPAPPAAAALPPPARGGGGCAGPAPAAGKAPRQPGAVRGERRSPPQVGAPGGAGCAPAGEEETAAGGGRREQEASARERSALGQRPSVPAAPSPAEVGAGLGDPGAAGEGRLGWRGCS